MTDPNETTALDALTSDPRNARRHTERNVGTMGSARRDVGAARSIVVDENGVILAGNATVKASASAGITSVRVVETDGAELVAVRRSGLTAEQKRRLALLDNRAAELAEWDTEMLASLAEDTDFSGLWDEDELIDLLGLEDAAREALVDPDEIPEPPEGPITQLGDLWLLDKHRLLCGDATDAASVRSLMN